jgi:hypothetical protein
MATAGVELESPFVSLFSKGDFSQCDSYPSLPKRGRGDFSDGTIRELQSQLLGQNTDVL